MKRDILSRISRGVFLLDGATGTMLQAAGLPAGTAPELWNLSHPEAVTGIHRAYLSAGADAITVNSFGINGLRYEKKQLEALLSAALAGRSGNRGDCVQACRWEYEITEKNRKGERLPIYEDDRGTYILNSKDLNMLSHIGELIDAGVYSFKIEGRMKSQYYVASVVNAYRQAIDGFIADKNYEVPALLSEELEKNSHRDYTTGFYYGEKDSVCSDTSQPKCDWEFTALVTGYDENKGAVALQQRNRFRTGDVLEILSPDKKYFGKTLKIEEMYDENGAALDDAKLVQQTVYVPTEYKLAKGDILRKRVLK